MIHRAYGLRENAEKQNGNARIFGESFRLEDSLLMLLDDNWHIDGYVDEQEIEHIRMYRVTDEAADPEQWEILRFEEDEAPLELLMLQEDM